MVWALVLLHGGSARPTHDVSGAGFGVFSPWWIPVQDNVRWLDQERIVQQMLRVNLHQSQYVDAVRVQRGPPIYTWVVEGSERGTRHSVHTEPL